jgi:hydroxyacyl-ACP dehydratase HTD2-like protein with hotdog domain
MGREEKMEKVSYITPEIQALLGQEVVWKATEPVDAGKIRRFTKSLGLDNPVYYDLENGQPVGPPTFIFSVNHDSLGEMDESGRPAQRLSLPSPFGPPMRGGNKYQFFQLVRVGDQIWMKRKVTDLKEKQGRTGVLLFLTYDMHYTNQNSDLLGINTETLIFRVTQGGKEKNKKANPPDFEDFEEGREIPPHRVTVSKVQMMMYAAATWNPYQLHWDSDFSRKRGFADANIAGPMFGAYLAEMLVKWADCPSCLRSLEYTNRDMGFPGDTLICRGKVKGRRPQGNTDLADCQVWVENQKGGILVQGSATVSLS